MAGMFEHGAKTDSASTATFKSQLNKVYAWYTGGFLAFVVTLAVLEQMGLPKNWIGFIFLLATVGLYAGIGIMSRTTDAAEYYVAGRRVPALYNGMATGADWMSAASFIGMAGTVYLSGYGGLAFIMGWTGGYCLVALFLAPYMRKFGQFTIPDFLGARFEGNLPRFIGIVGAILCSFTYVVAQIYGVGLITTRLTGFAFEVGIFVGLGGILVCSFLGGMRAVTWTQVAQYIILIVAYMVPVVWLSIKQTGVPVPQAMYGYQLQKVTEKEKQLIADPKEQEVINIFKQRAADADAKLKDVPAAMAADLAAAQKKVDDLKAANGPVGDLQAAERALLRCPRASTMPRRPTPRPRPPTPLAPLPLAGMPPHAQHFAGDPNGDDKAKQTFDPSRRNFLALIFCLMVGTAALPHILMRYYTTPSVKEARDSVTWSLFFIFLLYFTAPALAVLVKYEMFNVPVGTPFDKLPAWIISWAEGRPGAAVGRRHQQGRHLPARRNAHRRRHHRAGHAGHRWPAVCGLGHGGGGWPCRRAVHRRRPAADDRQCAVARPVLQDDRPERADRAPCRHLEGLARRRRFGGSGCGGAETGGHPVPGLGGVLVRGGVVLPGAGARHLLEARQQVGRHAGHDRRPGHDLLLHGRRRNPGCAACSASPRRSPTTSGGASSRSRPACSACRWALR